MNKLNDLDVGWIAGLLEAEGWIYVNKDGFVRIGIQMADLDVINRLPAITRIGVLERPREKEGYKDMYRWSINKQVDCYWFLKQLLPHLGYRRTAKAVEALTFLTPKAQAKEEYDYE